jgi:signal transduction histidine kinase
MSIKTRLALLLGLLLLGFLASWLMTRQIERRETERMLADARANRVQVLNHWIDTTGRSLPQFAAEFAQADELTKPVDRLSTESRARLALELKQGGVEKLWLLRTDGAPQLAIDSAGSSEVAPLPLSPQEFVSLVDATPNPHFYAEQNGELVELSIRRLVATANGNQNGWLMLGRRWDEGHLQTLAGLTESKISLVSASANSRPDNTAAGVVVVLRPLADWRGHEIRVLRVEHTESDLAEMTQADARTVRVFIAFGLLVMTAVGIALQVWVLRPLKRISESLAQKNPAVLGPLKSEPTELGHVARLVEFSFEQTAALRKNEEALRHTMEERARLGWNLHDGVIQSLYAAGMGLSGVRALLGPEQNAAVGHLEQVRGILNETIHDVRNFITGLEPEALKQQSFGQAVAGLLATMQAIRPMRTTLEIDEAVAARLTLPQRVHVLQIVREAVSNALRHGNATQVSVTLRPDGKTAGVEITDDGHGFKPGVPSQGKGLANIAERARELGAELTVDSAPGKGTRLKLNLTSLIPHD